MWLLVEIYRPIQTYMYITVYCKPYVVIDIRAVTVAYIQNGPI